MGDDAVPMQITNASAAASFFIDSPMVKRPVNWMR